MWAFKGIWIPVAHGKLFIRQSTENEKVVTVLQFRLTTKKPSRSALVIGGFPTQRASRAANVYVMTSPDWIFPSSTNLRRGHTLKTLRPTQNGRHFANDIFRYISRHFISIKSLSRFVPNGPFGEISALVPWPYVRKKRTSVHFKSQKLKNSTLLVLTLEYSRKKNDQYHFYWCIGPLRRHVICSHALDNLRQTCSCLHWGRFMIENEKNNIPPNSLSAAKIRIKKMGYTSF